MPAKNRFKKAVENATYNTTDSIKDNIRYNIRENTIDNIRENISEKAVENILQKTGENILEKILETGKKGKGGNHTLYLSAEVGEALNKYAKKTKRSKSTLVDEILREVLINRL